MPELWSAKAIKDREKELQKEALRPPPIFKSESECLKALGVKNLNEFDSILKRVQKKYTNWRTMPVEELILRIKEVVTNERHRQTGDGASHG